MYQRILAAIAASAIAFAGAVVTATPASAHTTTCTHGDHYEGHSPAYLMSFYRQADTVSGHKHTYKKFSNRNWLGNYTTFDGYVVVSC